MNKYGKQFLQIYFDIPHNLFQFETIMIDDAPFIVCRFNPTTELIDNCMAIAIEKVKHTMCKSQNSENRTYEQKIASQFSGVFAEMMTQIFLVEVCGIPFNNVKRYDLERKDFVYNQKDEFDVLFEFHGEEVHIEVRNSYSYHSLVDYCKSDSIIGAYINPAKKDESIARLYIRPIWQQTQEFIKEEIYENVISQKIIPYIVSGTDSDKMYGKDSLIENRGQSNTKYRCYPILLAGDALHFAHTVQALFIGSITETFLNMKNELVQKSNIKKDMQVLYPALSRIYCIESELKRTGVDPSKVLDFMKINSLDEMWMVPDELYEKTLKRLSKNQTKVIDIDSNTTENQ